MTNNNWSKEDIIDLIKEETVWYQKIELPYGLSTPGFDRSYVTKLALDRDLSGKTFLDVGCGEGYFVFEALKRGASKAVGIDLNSTRIKVAKKIAKILGLPGEFYVGNLEEMDFKEKFDIVFALNILHQVNNPIAVIEKLMSITREKLVFEIASFGKRDAWALGLNERVRKFFLKYPIIYVGRNGTSGTYLGGKYYFSPAALYNILMFHRHLFARCRIIPVAFKNRFLIIAEKRRIKNLLIIAGPTAVGKTTFLKDFYSGKLSKEFYKVFGVQNPREWKYVSSSRIYYLDEPCIEKLLLHYDFMRPYGSGRHAKVYERDEALDLIKCAEKVVIATLYAPSKVLKARLKKSDIIRPGKEKRQRIPQKIIKFLRRIRPIIRTFVRALPQSARKVLKMNLKRKFGKFIPHRPSKRVLEIYEMYRDENKVKDLYAKWYEFIRKLHGAKHIVIDVSRSTPRIFLIEDIQSTNDRLS